MAETYLVAIPIFNEETHLEGVLGSVRRHAEHILAINDGSTDRTAEILADQSDIHVITHPENRGYGKSLADAFDFARRGGYDWLITIDCDEQHEASFIPKFLERIRRDDADLVSGTRYPQGHDDETIAPADRRRINRLITARLNRDLGLDITDAFCGFKAYRVASLCHFRISVPGYAMPLQLWVQAARARLRICELPVRLIYNDPTRHFGGLLDNPAARLEHYLEVYRSEMAVSPVAAGCCGQSMERDLCP